MKKTFTFLAFISLLVTSITVKAQTILWSENFNSGTSRYFTLNTTDEGCSTNPRSAWAINNAYTGTSGTVQGSVPCNLGGNIAVGYNDANTASEPAGIAGYPNSYYLHILDTSEASIGVYCASWIIADNICVQAQNCFARMDTDINTTGLSNVTFKFWWMCYGNSKDVGKVYYSTDGGNTWTQITTPISNYNLSSTWAQQSISLPAFDNQATLRFGFLWVSTTGGTKQKDPPFCIDDIDIEVPAIVASDTITTSTITGSPFCACSSVSVPFTSKGGFVAGNIYTAQLSNASGSFAAPVTLDTLNNDTAHSGTITATIPCNTPTGAGYRIRVIGSSPSTTGTDNGINLTINAQVTASVSISANTSDTICAGTSVTFTAKPTNGGTPTYQWKLNGNNVGTNSSTYTSTTLNNNDVVSCVMTSNASCVTNSQSTSNSITITVNANVTASIIITSSNDTICSGSSATFTAKPTNGGTPSYQWQVNGGNAGTNSATYSSTGLNNSDVIKCIMTSTASCATGSPATSNTITMTVNANLPVSVSITSSGDTICAGNEVTFTAKPGNGGNTPGYQWELNGSNVGTNSATYTNSSLTTGDNVSCIMTSSMACITGSPASSNVISIVVSNTAPASVSISASPGDTICSGTPVTFTALAGNGGTPTYQWKLNGNNVGTDNLIYSNSSLGAGDKVTCVMTSSLACATGSPATSNQITITINSGLPASVSISANPGDTVCLGSLVTFTALPGNGGNAPAYQWVLNGTNVGTNSTSYSSSSLKNGDSVVCMMTSSLACATGSPATSAAIIVTVNNPLPASVSISANPGDTICSASPVTFTAVPQNGGNPGYQWMLNGSDVGTNNNSYSNNSLANGDEVVCIMTSSLACISGSPATSDTIDMTITSNLPASVVVSATPGDSICTGTTVNFTATAGNGGTPSYQWKLNGTDVGTNAASYSNNALANGEVVTCVMTSSLSCATGSPATSNSVSMNVVAGAVAGKITSTGSSICTGTLASLNDIGGSGGKYQWQSSSDSTTGFSNISGATSSGYSTTPLSANTYFRVVVANSSCADTTVSYKVTVSTPPTATFTASVNGSIVSFNSNGSTGATTYSWDFGDGKTSISANPTNNYDSVGIFEVCLTVKNSSNCNTTTCENVTTFPTGINSINTESSWQVSPNPFNGILYIRSSQLNNYVESIEVYDLLGRNVVLQKINGALNSPYELDLSHLESGVYYLRIRNKDNDFVMPVVKQ